MTRRPVAFTALRSRHGLRRVLPAYAFYCFVEIAAWLAIVMWAYGEGGPALAGAAGVAQLIPAAVLAPMLAGIGDRMPRGTALLLAHSAVTAATLLTLLALAGGAPVWLVIATSALITTSLAVVRPIHYATLPQLATSADDLVSANGLSAAGEQLSRFIGPIVAGVVVAASGPTTVMVIVSIAAALGAVLCIRLGLLAPQAIVESEPEGLRGALHGLSTLRGDWGSLALLLIMTTTFVLAGALDVLGIAYSDQVLGQGEAGAGFVIGAIGVGGLVGAAVATGVAGRRRLTPGIAVAGVVMGAVFASVALVSALPAAIALIALCGLADAVFMVLGRTLLQRSTDDNVLARVFAVQESTSLLGLATGAALAPFLIDALSPAGAFVPLGLAICVVVVIGSLLARRLDDRAVFRPRETALLRSVPFFAVLPAYELERLAQRVRWVDVPVGGEVVHQGDEGHEFYVVQDGRFSVTVDGEVKAHELGPESSFGEIALLHEVARTATVTALAPGRVLVVARSDFLAAVTGSSDGHALAREVSARHMSRDVSR